MRALVRRSCAANESSQRDPPSGDARVYLVPSGPEANASCRLRSDGTAAASATDAAAACIAIADRAKRRRMKNMLGEVGTIDLAFGFRRTTAKRKACWSQPRAHREISCGEGALGARARERKRIMPRGSTCFLRRWLATECVGSLVCPSHMTAPIACSIRALAASRIKCGFVTAATELSHAETKTVRLSSAGAIRWRSRRVPALRCSPRQGAACHIYMYQRARRCSSACLATPLRPA